MLEITLVRKCSSHVGVVIDKSNKINKSCMKRTGRKDMRYSTQEVLFVFIISYTSCLLDGMLSFSWSLYSTAIISVFMKPFSLLVLPFCKDARDVGSKSIIRTRIKV